jgi:hypothetical protein
MARRAKRLSRERRRANYLIRRIRDFLMTSDWKIRLSTVGEDPTFRRRFETNAGTIGLCDYEEETLHVHYGREFLVVVVHEALHAIYPDNSERHTYFLEELVMRHISPAQAKNIIIAAALCLV